MSTLHSGEDLAASIDDSTQTLREVHERLVAFISAHSVLSNATLRLADSIVEFYSPEDDGFAPAIAFQTIAAEGTSGLLCAQVQALVKTALRPLASFTAELSEVDALVKLCKEAQLRSQHYAKKVSDLNKKIETEKKEDRRAHLHEKAARNNAKLAAAYRERNEVSEKVYRLVETSQRSRYACFNPVFASICQFQEASCSHAHLLSTMLMRVVRSSLGSTSLSMAAADAPSSIPSPTCRSRHRSSRCAPPCSALAHDEGNGVEGELGAGCSEENRYCGVNCSDDHRAENSSENSTGNHAEHRSNRCAECKAEDSGDNRSEGLAADIPAEGRGGAGCNGADGEADGNACASGDGSGRGGSGTDTNVGRDALQHPCSAMVATPAVAIAVDVDDDIDTDDGTIDGERSGGEYEESNGYGETNGATATALTTEPGGVSVNERRDIEGRLESLKQDGDDDVGGKKARGEQECEKDANEHAAVAKVSFRVPSADTSDAGPAMRISPPASTAMVTIAGAEAPPGTVEGMEEKSSVAAPCSAFVPTPQPPLPSRHPTKAVMKASTTSQGSAEPPAAASAGSMPTGGSKAGVLWDDGSTARAPRESFLEGHLPWGKRRRMSGVLVRKGSGGGRGSVGSRQVFCVAEGPELLVFDVESDSVAGLSPRSRFLVRGARSVPAGRGGTMELEVTVTEEIDAFGTGSARDLLAEMMASQQLVGYTSTRAITFVVSDRHEHARWVLALDEAKCWKEDVEREALLEELELSLPFREGALRHLRYYLADSRIEDILGVTAAKMDPGCVLKSTSFDDAVVATLLASNSSPENSIGSAGSGNNNSSHGNSNTHGHGHTNNAGTHRRTRPSFGGIGSGMGAGSQVVGNRRRSSSDNVLSHGSSHGHGHGHTLRGFFSRFDHSKSTNEHGARGPSSVGPSTNRSGGGSGDGGGGGLGGAGSTQGAGTLVETSAGGTTAGGVSTRWSVSGTKSGRWRTNRRTDTSPPSRTSEYRSPSRRSASMGGSAAAGVAAVASSMGGRIRGRSGITIELGSPLSQRAHMDASSITFAEPPMGSTTMWNEGGSTLSRVREEEGHQYDETLGEFIGGGHPMCLSRSRSKAQTPSSTTVFDIFPELQSFPSFATTVTSASSGCEGSCTDDGSDPPSRRPSRERSILLHFLQQSSSPPGSDYGLSLQHHRGQLPLHQLKHSAFSVSSSFLEGAPRVSLHSASAPSTPAGRSLKSGEHGGFDGNKGSTEGPWEAPARTRAGTVGVGVHSGKCGGNSGEEMAKDAVLGIAEHETTLPLMPPWLVMGQHTGLGNSAGDLNSMACGGSIGLPYSTGGGGGPGGGGLSGINPYIARRPSHASSRSCADSSSSCNGDANGAMAGSQGNNTSSTRQWTVWFQKDEMPALPRKSASALGWSSAPAHVTASDRRTPSLSGRGTSIPSSDARARESSRGYARMVFDSELKAGDGMNDMQDDNSPKEVIDFMRDLYREEQGVQEQMSIYRRRRR